MTGTQTIDINSKRYSYHLELTRKVTVISGDSGTGKTALIDDINWLKETSPDDIASSVPVYALSDDVATRLVLYGIGEQQNSIICVDEGNLKRGGTELASAINKSNNYFILATREIIEGVPYSPSSIKILHTDENKHHTLRQRYGTVGQQIGSISKPDIIICEDGASGFQFFSLFASRPGTILTAKGKDNLYQKADELSKQNPSKQILIIADGCAFGSCLDKNMQMHDENPKISLYLPESFEYVLLYSPIFDRDPIVQEILSDPLSHIESSYASGERFFTAVLESAMKRLGQTYSKSKLSPCFYDLCCYKGKPCKGKVMDRSSTKQAELLRRIGKLDLSNI